MKILVTGVNGFVGHHLAHSLRSKGCEVYGVGLQPTPAEELKGILSKYFSLDLSDLDRVRQLPLAKLDGVISLAGLADVGKSFKEPEKYMEINTSVVSNISQCLIESSDNAVRHLAISSGAVYNSSQTPPFNEDSEVDSTSSPYVKSKLAMEKLCQGHRAQGLDVIIARPFNHIGPGQEVGFLLPDLVTQIKKSLLDGAPIMVGNLDTRRDYTDVRDVANAYSLLIMNKPLKSFVYNVCSGKSVAGNQILDTVLDVLSKDKKPQVIVDPGRFRPSDAPELFGSPHRLHAETGWQTSIDLNQTIHDFILGNAS